VSDGFWDDPDLADLTHEERCTLLLLLTSKQSNVIGVYRIIWRQVGAGAGWTQDQVLNAARNLKAKGCLDIDESTGWVWVKEWWKHNSLRGAFTGNVAKKAAQELNQVPEFWKQAILDWIAGNDNEGACKGLISPLQGAGGNHTTNPSSTPSSNTTTSTPQPVVEVVEIDDLVEAAVWATPAITSEAGFRRTVRERIRSEGANPEDKRSLDAWRCNQKRVKEEKEKAVLCEQERQATAVHDAEKSVRSGRASEYFESLGDTDRAMLIDHFTTHLAASNNGVFQLYRRKDLQSKVVLSELFKFITDTILSASIEEAMA